MARAELDKAPTDVAAMFDGVADHYDLTNTVLSAGQDHLWRRAVTRALDPQSGDRILDLAAGTGVSSEPLAKAGADVIACDFSLGMLEAGRRSRPHVTFVAGDATALPFADDSFDAVTISFGLRNVVDTVAGLAEMARVTRPGGRLVVCEFSRPPAAALRAPYTLYLTRLLPRIATAVATNPEAYTYLADSIIAWPDQVALARLILDAGWTSVAWRNLSAGIVAVHSAVAR